jgi:hypothetical protein
VSGCRGVTCTRGNRAPTRRCAEHRCTGPGSAGSTTSPGWTRCGSRTPLMNRSRSAAAVRRRPVGARGAAGRGPTPGRDPPATLTVHCGVIGSEVRQVLAASFQRGPGAGRSLATLPEWQPNSSLPSDRPCSGSSTAPAGRWTGPGTSPLPRRLRPTRPSRPTSTRTWRRRTAVVTARWCAVRGLGDHAQLSAGGCGDRGAAAGRDRVRRTACATPLPRCPVTRPR